MCAEAGTRAEAALVSLSLSLSLVAGRSAWSKWVRVCKTTATAAAAAAAAEFGCRASLAPWPKSGQDLAGVPVSNARCAIV